MSGLCGWLSGSEQLDERAVLQAMAARLWGRCAVQFASCGPTNALAAKGRSASVCAEGSIRAAVDGEVRFDDMQLNGVATASGAAAGVVAAFRQRGPRFLEDAQGSFAIALVDAAQQRALLATDRVGSKPLAYATRADSLVFASTADAVTVHPCWTNKVDRQALFDYVFFHVVPSPRTIFADVHKLPPASLLEWTHGRVAVTTHWLPTFHERATSTWDELAEKFLLSLRRSVERTRPGSSTGTFLSGGIDSSTITGLLAELQGRGRPAYTLGFSQSGYDETGYAQVAAKHFGADLRVHYVAPDEVAEAFVEIANLYDEPFGNSSAVPALIGAKLAFADGIDHLLAGDGGDELFAGNTRYAKQQVFELYHRAPTAARKLLDAFARTNGSAFAPARKIRSYVSQARMPMPDRLESYNFVVREGVTSIFDPAFLRAVDADAPLKALRERYAGVATSSLTDRMLYLDWKFTLADNDLRKVAATCQHAGVEVSFPWLDDEVVDLSTRVPGSWKMRGTNLRFFAKRALASFLPLATLEKSKHGFGLPFGEWLKQSPGLQARIYALLSDLRHRGIFRQDFVEKLILAHRDGHAAYYGTMVWVLAILEGWLQGRRLDA